MKADAAKFEAEAKTPSSFVEVSPTLDVTSPYERAQEHFQDVEKNMQSDALRFKNGYNGRERDAAPTSMFEVTATTWPSSLVQTSDTPGDDGFAKVEAKLKALEEKMKADAAKFEAEAKTPSSFAQTNEIWDVPQHSPFDSQLQSYQDRMKDDALQVEAQLHKESAEIKGTTMGSLLDAPADSFSTMAGSVPGLDTLGSMLDASPDSLLETKHKVEQLRKA